MLKRATVLLIWTASALCAQMAPYPRADLDRVAERAVPHIRTVFEEDIKALLPRDLRPAAAGIRLAFPDQGRGPLDFYARPDTQTVYMPLSSIRFFDDMSTLYAWFEFRGCDAGYLQAYLAALLAKGEALPRPLEAFAVDREVAFADPDTYGLSGKIYSSGLQFILAHEVGHLLLAHRTDVTLAESRRQEAAADAFALDHFSRLGGNPGGVFFYFQMAWWSDPTRAAAHLTTHPVSADRIRAVGDRMAERPQDFAHGELDVAREAQLARQLGQMLSNFAMLIDDDLFVRARIELMERDYPMSRLALACPS